MLRSLTVRDPQQIDSLQAEGFNAMHVEASAPNLPILLEVAAKYSLPVYARIRLLERPGLSDTSPTNTLGQQVEGAECPSQPLAQDRCLQLCERIAAQFPWAGLQLMGLGFRSFASHATDHAESNFYRSICFCAACQYGYGAAGSILEHVAREAIETPSPKHPTVDTMLLWRRSVQYGLLRQIHDLVSTPLCLHTAAELRYAGDKSSLTFEEAQGLVASCSVDPESPEELARLTSLPRPMPIYCTSNIAPESFAGVIL
jgi:hypothetical protein